MRAPLILIAAAFAMLGESNATSAASTATVWLGGATAYYRAGWNEQNHVRVYLSPGGHMIIHDSGAPVSAIPGPSGDADMCAQVNPHTVDCGSATNLYGYLNDLDDFASFNIFNPAYSVAWNGASGIDFLRGGAGNDTLIGDANSNGSVVGEAAYGRGGNDTISSVYYADGGAGSDKCWVFNGGTMVNCER